MRKSDFSWKTTPISIPILLATRLLCLTPTRHCLGERGTRGRPRRKNWQRIRILHEKVLRHRYPSCWSAFRERISGSVGPHCGGVGSPKCKSDARFEIYVKKYSEIGTKHGCVGSAEKFWKFLPYLTPTYGHKNFPKSKNKQKLVFGAKNYLNNNNNNTSYFCIYFHLRTFPGRLMGGLRVSTGSCRAF